jgi:hypothetical protein
MANRPSMTKSPLALAKQALVIAQKTLPQYSNCLSRHDFTQAQLFAILTMRQFFKIESIFSRFKRRPGYALTARSSKTRTVECLLRVLTYNLMIFYLLFKKSFLLMFSTEHFKFSIFLI